MRSYIHCSKGMFISSNSGLLVPQYYPLHGDWREFVSFDPGSAQFNGRTEVYLKFLPHGPGKTDSYFVNVNVGIDLLYVGFIRPWEHLGFEEFANKPSLN